MTNNNSVSRREYHREYRLKHNKHLKALRKEWLLSHKVQYAAYQKDYHSNRMKTNVQYRLACSLRSRLRKALQRNTKVGSPVRDLGCTIPELKFYLEGQFQDGMTWENHSLKGWHIDHKIPLAFFDLTNREQFLKACHYTNLQPLWAKENLTKSSKVPEDNQMSNNAIITL